MAIEAAGLEVLALYGCTTDGIPRQPVNEDTHTKSIYVTRLKEAGDVEISSQRP